MGIVSIVLVQDKSHFETISISGNVRPGCNRVLQTLRSLKWRVLCARP